MEHATRDGGGGYLRQFVQEATGWMEQGCGPVNSASIHYIFKLQVK